MPQVTTTLRTPNYAAAPASPTTGQLYYDTVNKTLYCRDDAVWRSTFEVYEGAAAPSPRGGYLLWLDTTIP